MGINIPEVERQTASKALIVIVNVRFGSLTDKPSPAKIRLCLLWSNSGQTPRGPTDTVPTQ
jgi:hypothetical protein